MTTPFSRWDIIVTANGWRACCTSRAQLGDAVSKLAIVAIFAFTVRKVDTQNGLVPYRVLDHDDHPGLFLFWSLWSSHPVLALCESEYRVSDA